MSIGYARAARLIDELEAAGVVAPAVGSEPREVLIHSAAEVIANNSENPLGNEIVSLPEPLKNYKMPSGIKLSKAEDIPWGTPFNDLYKRTDFKDSKVEFPIPFGFDGEGNLKIESLLDANNLIIAGTSSTNLLFIGRW